jgi:RHS repeat-associated protein
VGIFDEIESLADSVVTTLEHVTGTVADEFAHMVGSGLREVGLTDAANSVDAFGDHVADALGDQVAELQLGQSNDPTQLLHGDVNALSASAQHLHNFASAFGSTATGLSDLDSESGNWQGGAADAFRARMSPHVQEWSRAQHACNEAGDAMEAFANAVKQAQSQAQQAINLYNEGVLVTEQAETSYNQQVDAFNQAADAYNANVNAGFDPGPAPTEPGPFTDPGASLREQARQLLDTARQQRDAAGAQAQSAVADATALAPAEPSFLERLADNAQDLLGGLDVGAQHFAGGIVKGAAQLVAFARGLDPLDPYNLLHPAQYLTGLSNTSAGLIHAALHPSQLISGLVGTGWGSDPFEAAGRLVPNVALALVTDGAGTEAGVGTDVAEAGVREAAGTAIDTAREPVSMICKDDPIDVSSGNMVLPVVDLELPGVLPLLLERTHISSYRLGRCFGRSWASTMDQRLVVDDAGILYTAPDGVVLFYPRTDGDEPVLPEEGGRKPLIRTPEGYALADPRTGHITWFSPVAGRYPVTALTDRHGNRIEFAHDAQGNPTEIRHPGGTRVRIGTADGRITDLAAIAADGAEIPLLRFGYTDGDLTEVVNFSGAALTFAYDDAGRIVEWRDRNDTWYRYTYDTDGRCTHVEGSDGFLTGDFTYDRENLVTEHTDAFGAITRYQLDERLRVITETSPLGATTHSEWDHHGNLLSRTDPLGRVTTHHHDERGNVVETVRQDGSTTRTEYDRCDRPVAVTDPDGSTWRYTYDDLGNRTGVIDPLGAITRLRYDEAGRLVGTTDALGRATRIEPDEAGLAAVVIGPDGRRTERRRDALGRVIEEIGPDGGVTRNTWTPQGWLAARTAPDGATESWSHDGEGNPVEHTDPVGQITRYEYTHFDLVAARTTPDGARLAYTYDEELRLVAVTNQQGRTWRYAYDEAGGLLAETDFHGRVQRYLRDLAGQLVRRVNGAGEVTDYRYDALGNLVEQRCGDAVTTFDYDQLGRLVHAVNADADLTLRRDATGRVLAETVNGRTLTSTYDAAGRRTRRVTPSGVETDWDYDAAGRPSALRTGDRRVAFDYDLGGQEIERRVDAAFRLTQTWDRAHRLTGQHLLGPEPGDARLTRRVLQQRDYTYRPDGNLTGVDDQLAGARTFELDQVGQITAVHGRNGSEHYRYDPAGNLTAATVPGRDDPAAWEYTGTLLTRAGRTRYGYDGQGRLAWRGERRLSGRTDTWRFTWDADNRLTGVLTPGGAHWRYRYDPLGRRIAKQRVDATSGAVLEQTDFTWDGATLAEQVHNATAHTTWDYRPGTHTPLTQTERTGEPGQDWYDSRFYAIVTDLVGTPTELVDQSGALAWHQPTTVWGAALGRLGNRAATPLRFPGQYHDPETGLHYNHQRYYDPATARYASPDPLGLAPAPNPVTYVANPNRLIDPLGLMSCLVQSVIDETNAGTGNITSAHTLSADQALDAGLQWLGPNYREIGDGVFRSADGLRQFRIDPNSIAGNHAPNVPHVHLETYAPGARYPSTNNHIPITGN